MYFKSLHSYILFTKGLKNYNRKTDKTLQKRQIHCLYSILLLDGKDKYVSFNAIRKSMSFCGISDDYRNIQTLVNKCVSEGYVIKMEDAYKFKLSLEGINTITELELRIRKERWNR